MDAIDQKSFGTPVAYRAALASGSLGVLAAGCLIAADQLRAWRVASRPVVRFLFSSHDVATIFQSMLLVLAIVVAHRIYRQRLAGVGLGSVVVSVTALSAIALLQALRLVNIGPDTLYMVPQGLLGICLVVTNVRARKVLPAPVVGVGVVAGLGLVMIAASFLVVIGYFGLGALSGPIRASDEQARRVNRIVHLNLDAGTLLGKPAYPVWILLVARALHLRAPRDRFSGTL
jgi:hypothetical protein